MELERHTVLAQKGWQSWHPSKIRRLVIMEWTRADRKVISLFIVIITVSKEKRKKELSVFHYLLLFTLVIINDALDFLGILTPQFELILDILTAVGIILLFGSFNPWLFLIALADVIPGIDLAPFWTLYALYSYFKGKGKVSKEEKMVKVKVE